MRDSTRRPLVLVVYVAVYVAACLCASGCSIPMQQAGGGAIPAGDRASTSETETACSAIGRCTSQADEQDCNNVFKGLAIANECIDAIEQATCADVAATSPSYVEICFPRCGGGASVCNGDGTVSTCSAYDDGTMRLLVVDCSSSCAAQGLTYSGTCGSTYMDKTSGTGEICWCQ